MSGSDHTILFLIRYPIPGCSRSSSGNFKFAALSRQMTDVKVKLSNKQSHSFMTWRMYECARPIRLRGLYQLSRKVKPKKKIRNSHDV